MVMYKAAREGIRIIEQEESYTSKADITAKDPMPVYGREEGIPMFSGRRSSGYFDIRRLDGTKVHASVSYRKLRFLETRHTTLTERRTAG